MGIARTLRRYRPWWPPGIALAGALLVILIVALRGEPVDQGVAGPLLAVSLIAGLAGLATGVAEGLVQPSASLQLRIQTVLVVLALVAAGTLRSGALVAGLAAIVGAAAALGLRWCGRRVLEALVGRDESEP
ncbi:MAG: hypothetical protein ACRDJL_03625 [Actinomycetota bacterium]